MLSWLFKTRVEPPPPRPSTVALSVALAEHRERQAARDAIGMSSTFPSPGIPPPGVWRGLGPPWWVPRDSPSTAFRRVRPTSADGDGDSDGSAAAVARNELIPVEAVPDLADVELATNDNDEAYFRTQSFAGDAQPLSLDDARMSNASAGCHAAFATCRRGARVPALRVPPHAEVLAGG